MAALHILLADDDPDDVLMIAEAIKEVQHDVQIVTANNGEEALELLNNHPALKVQVCLVILDLNMPKMNGTQTLMALKSDLRLAKIPVIIYSTSVNKLEKEKCLLLGAHSYITKPLTQKENIRTAAFFIELCKVRSLA